VVLVGPPSKIVSQISPKLTSAIPCAVGPPFGERAGVGAATTFEPFGRARTLAVPAGVCSALLGRRCAGWLAAILEPEASPPEAARDLAWSGVRGGGLPAERLTAPGAKPGAASRSSWLPPMTSPQPCRK
jgi:hypothetical protein